MLANSEGFLKDIEDMKIVKNECKMVDCKNYVHGFYQLR